MAKKIISVAALLFFLWFDICCTIHNTKWITVDQAKGKNDKVLFVIKKTGEIFEFPKKAEGAILGNEVVGEHFLRNQVINVSDIKQRQANDQNQIVLITTNDGRVISVENAREIGGKIYQMVKGSIPLSEIEKLFVKKVSNATTISSFFIVASIVASVVVIFVYYFLWGPWGPPGWH